MDISKPKKTLLVTGGAGFIGSHFVDRALAEGCEVIVFDKLTYAGNLANLSHSAKHPLYKFVLGDITDREVLRSCFEMFQPTQIVHFAAESHVDRSIEGPEDFLQTNVVGTFRLLEAARGYFEKLSESQRKEFRFFHISTDEVFGSLEGDDVFHMDDPYRPNSPYSASKAASDLFVRAYYETYKLPVIISNCTNNYGPRQHGEKFIPTVIRNCLNETRIPVYGKGTNQRDWIYVKDHVDGVWRALIGGVPGQSYGFAGQHVVANLEMAKGICALMDEIRPRPSGKSYQELIAFVEDRKGHDFRYALDDSESVRVLGYAEHRRNFKDGLRETLDHYIALWSHERKSS